MICSLVWDIKYHNHVTGFREVDLQSNNAAVQKAECDEEVKLDSVGASTQGLLEDVNHLERKPGWTFWIHGHLPFLTLSCNYSR